MTPLENELRATLADRAPEDVDASTWAENARTRATRHRRRVTGALTLGAVILAATVSGFLIRDAQQPTLPARPQPTNSVSAYAALCALQPTANRGLWGDVPSSRKYSMVAMCPDDPDDLAWADLPMPAVLSGRYLDRLAIGGGPPVENCEGSRPALPGYYIVTRDLNGFTTFNPSQSERCGGAQLAQSFAAGLAEQLHDAIATPGRGCHDLFRADDSAQPPNFTNPSAIHVCITGDPYTEAEPGPLRFRPVRSLELRSAGRQSLLHAFAGATMTTGRYTDCPWRHATIKVVTTTASGARAALLFRCQQDFDDLTSAAKLSTMQASWPSVPEPAEALLEREIAGYLAGQDNG